MTFALVLDMLIAILLIATISYAILLNRRLSDLRKNQTELDKLARSFDNATLRAEESITKLTNSSESMKRDILETMTKAETLRDDLSFLIERAGSSADKLEDSVRSNRAEPPAYAGKKIKDTVAPATAKSETRQAEKHVQPEENDKDYKPKTDAERELLKALQSVR